MAQGNPNNIIVNIYDGFINWLRRLFLAVRQNIVLCLICIACAISLMFLYNNGRKDKFSVSFTVSYDDMVRKIYGDRLYKLNKLIKNNEYNKVAQYLGISKTTAMALVEVKGKNILGENLTDDMNTDRIPFVISLKVTDSSAVPKIQQGLVNFLEEGNAYSAMNKALKIKEIEDEIQFIDKQLTMMDSLKKKYNTESLSVDDKGNSLTTIYNFSYELYKVKKDLMKKRALPGTIHVIDDAIAAEAMGLPAVTLILAGIISGFLLFVFILLFIKPVFVRN